MTNTTNFMEETLIAHEESQRRTGRTTRIALDAIQKNAVMVCHNQTFASDLYRDYGHLGLVVVSLDKYLSKEYHTGKTVKPHVFDHVIEFKLILKKLKEVDDLINEFNSNN